jgi:hypothetical protein
LFVAARHIRAALQARRAAHAGRRVTRTATGRASNASSEGGLYDTHVGHKARNSRTVNAPKGW